MSRLGVPRTGLVSVNGWLVLLDDPTALAQAVIELLRDPQLAARIGAAGLGTCGRIWRAKDGGRNREPIRGITGKERTGS